MDYSTSAIFASLAIWIAGIVVGYLCYYDLGKDDLPVAKRQRNAAVMFFAGAAVIPATFHLIGYTVVVFGF